MSPQKTTPLKVGLLIVALAYLLFNVHSMFNLNWWGEWERITTDPTWQFYIYIEDVVAAVGMATRLVASVIAVGAVAYYFKKGMPSTNKLYRILKAILILEAIYWFGLSATAGVEVYTTMVIPQPSLIATLTRLMVGPIPTVMEAIVFPIVLLVLAFKLNPNKPAKTPIKWALITGTVLLFVFWLTNTSIWISTISYPGWSGVTNFAVNTLTFILTVFGLLALALFTAGYTVSYSRGNSPLNLKIAGVIILALGMYFLWNYLAWVFFDVNNNLWSNWYAWFLGHNLDLWMLSLPLFAIPLLFSRPNETASSV
ncbi:MAG: hypothetical protein ACQCN6_10805 [Candidatus Bathyarchaeia archaeon]|jgi:hypothetical protein